MQVKVFYKTAICISIDVPALLNDQFIGNNFSRMPAELQKAPFDVALLSASYPCDQNGIKFM